MEEKKVAEAIWVKTLTKGEEDDAAFNKNRQITNIFTILKTEFNPVLACTCLLLVCSSFSHGFDNQGFSTIQAMDSFTEQFGEYNTATREYSIPAYFYPI